MDTFVTLYKVFRFSLIGRAAVKADGEAIVQIYQAKQKVKKNLRKSFWFEDFINFRCWEEDKKLQNNN